MTGDFSDTESDKLFHEQAVKSGKIRFEKKVKQLKDHNDLRTVKESGGLWRPFLAGAGVPHERGRSAVFGEVQGEGGPLRAAARVE